MQNDFEKCKFLIEQRADVNVVSHKQKRAAIHIASSLNNVKIFELLVDNGSGTLAEDKKGRTAFQIAKNRGFPQIANFYARSEFFSQRQPTQIFAKNKPTEQPTIIKAGGY